MQEGAAGDGVVAVGRGLVRIGLAALVGVAVLGYATAGGWLTSLLQHFPAYYAWAALLLFGVARLCRSQRWVQGGCLLAALGFGLYWATPRLPTAVPQLQDPVPVRVVWANVQHKTRNVRALLEWIETLDPPVEVLGLAELHHEESLRLVRERFPHGLHDRATGVALLARTEPQDMQSVWVQNGRPILHLSTETQGRRLDLVAAHALVPSGGGQPGIQAMGQLLRGLDHAALIADLNLTPWAREFRGLLRDGDLRDGRRGRWPVKTWGPRGSSWVGLPIDHALVRGEVVVEGFVVGPDLGSDHRPLVVDLSRGADEPSLPATH